MAGNRRNRYMGGLHNPARPKRVNEEAGWLAICGSWTSIYSFSVIRMVMTICLEKYIVKSSEFPPPYRGRLGRTVMDSKLFWINRKSFFLLPSSSWKPPMLFLHQRANARGGQSVQWRVLGLVSFTELSTWPWLLVGSGEFAGVAGMMLWRQLQACPCWRQFYYSWRHPSRQEDQRKQELLLLLFPYHDSWGSLASGLWGQGSRTVMGTQAGATDPMRELTTSASQVAEGNRGGDSQDTWVSLLVSLLTSCQILDTTLSSLTLFSLYGIRTKIKENCRDLVGESKGQSAVLWFGECGSF